MASKMWKEKPPGPEQRELERMFQNNEIDSKATPDSVRKTKDAFMEFPAKTFAAHFRKTKAKMGLCATVPAIDLTIPELGTTINQPAPTDSTASNSQYSMTLEDVSNIEFESPPFCTWTYTDHQKKSDFVCVVAPVISGSRKITFDLSQDGTFVTIHYFWPCAIYKSKELFNDAILKKEILPDHPQIHSFVSHWLDSGITENSEPKGRIVIQLPCKVKRELGSWKAKPIKVNDTKLILLEFTAYQKALLVDDADTSINFD